jgi:hypothetical protein
MSEEFTLTVNATWAKLALAAVGTVIVVGGAVTRVCNVMYAQTTAVSQTTAAVVQVTAKMDSVESRLDQLSVKQSSIEARLRGVESSCDRIERKVGG